MLPEGLTAYKAIAHPNKWSSPTATGVNDHVGDDSLHFALPVLVEQSSVYALIESAFARPSVPTLGADSCVIKKAHQVRHDQIVMSANMVSGNPCRRCHTIAVRVHIRSMRVSVCANNAPHVWQKETYWHTELPSNSDLKFTRAKSGMWVGTGKGQWESVGKLVVVGA